MLNADHKHSTQIGYIKVEAKIVETMILLLKVQKCASILNTVFSPLRPMIRPVSVIEP